MTMDTSGVVKYYKNNSLLATSANPATSGTTFYYAGVGNASGSSANDVEYVIAVPATFDSGNISAGGGTFSHTFNTAGTYDYVCPLHNGMTGQIVVADSYSLPSGTEDFTVSAWTKTTQAPATIVYDEDYSGTNTYVEQDTGHFWWDSTNNRISFDTIRMSNINMSHELDTALSDKWVLRGTFEASALPN